MREQMEPNPAEVFNDRLAFFLNEYRNSQDDKKPHLLAGFIATMRILKAHSPEAYEVISPVACSRVLAEIGVDIESPGPEVERNIAFFGPLLEAAMQRAKAKQQSTTESA